MTSEIIRERAFYLYLIQGDSYNSIATTIRSEFGTRTTSKSIQAWSNKKDSAGMTWEDRRLAVTERTNHRVEVLAENSMVELRNRTSKLAEIIYNQLISDNAPKLKTFEGSVFAFKSLAEFEAKLAEAEEKKVTPFMIVNMIFEAITQVSDVNKAIKDNWDEVSMIIHEKFIKVDLNRSGVKEISDDRK
ncbi:MAG: hypothetical protein GW938_15535 [Leptospira sp.]|nr:hypothetical protein [Leptospira sp.]